MKPNLKAKSEIKHLLKLRFHVLMPFDITVYDCSFLNLIVYFKLLYPVAFWVISAKGALVPQIYVHEVVLQSNNT